MTLSAPKDITQGLPVTWLTRYRPAGITTSGKIFLRGPAAVTLESTVENGYLVFRATAEEAANLIPGLYFYEIRATTGVDVQVLERGRVQVAVNLADVGPDFDGLSANQKALAAINATLAARATGGTPVRYRINNRELYSESMSDLLALQRYYQNLVNAELAKESGADLWNRKIRFSLK